MGLDVFINEIKINEDVDKSKFINSVGLISKFNYYSELLKNENLFNKLKRQMIKIYNDLIYNCEKDLKLLNDGSPQALSQYKDYNQMKYLDYVIDPITNTFINEEERNKLISDTKKYLNAYTENLDNIKNISQDNLILGFKNHTDTILKSQPSIYNDIYYFDILKDPYIELDENETLYYRKEWDLVELVNDCLEKTFKNNTIKSKHIELINCAPYLINGDVIKEIISYLEASIKDLQNQLKNDYDIIENVIIDELDMYERWLSDFKLLDINKEYAFVISY